MQSRRPRGSPPCRLCGFSDDDPDRLPPAPLERLDQIDGYMSPAMPALKPLWEELGDEANQLVATLLPLRRSLQKAADYLPPGDTQPTTHEFLRALTRTAGQPDSFSALLAVLFPGRKRSTPGASRRPRADVFRYRWFLSLRDHFKRMAKQEPVASQDKLFAISLRIMGAAVLTPHGFIENPRIQEMRRLLSGPKQRDVSLTQIANLAAWAVLKEDPRPLPVLLENSNLLAQANSFADAARK